MRARTGLLVVAVAVLLLAWRCIGAPSAPSRPVPAAPGDVMVGVRPGLPPLKSTPSPFVRTPERSATTTTTEPPPSATPTAPPET